MKIALVNKFTTHGGASIACARLMNALNKIHVEASMVVQEKTGNCEGITSTTQSKVKELINFCRFVWERLCFLPHEVSKEDRFAFSLANTGEDISGLRQIQNADIIHMHWFNQGYLSMKDLQKLFRLGKPIVWTLHDMWAFTGGCHYSGYCKHYMNGCGNCPMIRRPYSNDLSRRIFLEKEKIYKNVNLTVVTCSKWLSSITHESSLLKNFKIINIPNPIDTSFFKPVNKQEARKELSLNPDKIYLLFAAGNIFDRRKGLQFIIDAIEKMQRETPQVFNQVELLVFGKAQKNIHSLFPLTVKNFGQISEIESLRKIYSAAHAFILPSLEDNLPNTIMESLACGTPVIAFRTGGIPEMVIHGKTGFLAEYKSVSSLTDGIRWIAENANTNFQKPCVEFVKNNYSEEIIANSYMKLYNELIDI